MSPQVGQPVQFFTSELKRQVDAMGAGPYAAQITNVFKGTMVDLWVQPGGYNPAYFAGSVMHEKDVPSTSNPRVYWRMIPEIVHLAVAPEQP